MSHPIITFEGIIKSYGTGEATAYALRGIDLSIEHGEFVAIMGPSGSGKSTAMNIIGCLDTPSSGNYLFEGVNVTTLGRDQRALLRRNYIGFIFQGFNLLGKTTAIENVELPLLYRGFPAHKRYEMAMEALKSVGLEHVAHHTPSELSGGQQQRISIVRVLTKKPKLIFADEPTGNLDKTSAKEVMHTIFEYIDQNKAAMMCVTHDEKLAFSCDAVYRLEHKILNKLK